MRLNLELLEARQLPSMTIPSISLSTSESSGSYGDNIVLYAIVSSIAGTPTGTVEFYDGGTDLQLGGGLVGGSLSLSYSLFSVGDHSITVVYAGDSNFSAITSGNLDLPVAKSVTSISVSSSANPINYGDNVVLSANVSGNGGIPTGSVEFYDGGISDLGGGIVDSNGNASTSVSLLPMGDRSITAIYSGDSNFSGDAWGSLDLLVNSATTSISVSASPNPAAYGDNIVFSANVSSLMGTPTGNVDFYDGGALFNETTLDASGNASFSVSTLSVGDHSITIVYIGDSNFSTVTSGNLDLPVTMSVTSISVSSSANPINYGDNVVLSANVSGNGGIPTGNVEFYDGGANDLGGGSVDANGNASASVSLLPAGHRSITAIYSGDSNFYGATSGSWDQLVNLASTSISVSASPNPAIYGDSIVFSANVSGLAGTPTGYVDFYDAGALLGESAVDSVGNASFSMSTLAVGDHSITVNYTGDTNFASVSSNSWDQRVNIATPSISVSSSPSTANYADNIALTAIVSRNGVIGTGSVEFFDGGTVLGSAVLDGSGAATFSVSTLVVGDHSINAIYVGDSNFLGSISAKIDLPVSLDPTSLSLSASKSLPIAGENVLLSAVVSTISGIPTGYVEFYDGSNILGSATLVGGIETLPVSWLSVGDHPIAAVYAGDNFRSNASGTLDLPVVALPTVLSGSSVSLSAAPNPAAYAGNVALTATVSGSPGIPSGQVDFYDGNLPLGTATLNRNGTATLNLSSFAVGDHAITADYSGDTYFAVSTSSTLDLAVHKLPTTISVSSSGTPTIHDLGVTVFLAARVTGPDNGVAPTGSVDFYDGATVLGSAALDSSGGATLPVSGLSVGSHAITATFEGDSNYTPITSAAFDEQVLAVLSQTVFALTTVSVSHIAPNPAAIGDTVALTAQVTSLIAGTPTGNVEFYDGGTDLGGASLDSTAHATRNFAPNSYGDHWITVVYAGDTTFAGCTSYYFNYHLVVKSPVYFDKTSASVYETIGTNGQEAVVTVDLGKPSSLAVSVDYATSNGGAIAGVNYTATSGTLNFMPGQITGTFTIPILNHNAVGTYPATVNLTLSNAVNATLTMPSTSILNIDDLTWVNPAAAWSPVPTPAPVISGPGNRTNPEGYSASLPIASADPENYPMTYEAVNLPIGLGINPVSGVISGSIDYQAAEDFGGVYPVTIIVDDNHGGSASTSFTWTITAAPRPPVLANPGDKSSIIGNADVLLPINATQPDGHPLTFDATGLPLGLSIDSGTGIISGIIDLSAISATPYSVTITATDNTPATPIVATQTFNWTVSLGIRSPSLDNPGDQTNAIGDPVDIIVNASDAGGYPLTFTAIGLPAGLSIDPNSGEIAGTIPTLLAGTTTTTITASDGQASISQTFNWTITPLAVAAINDRSSLEGNTVSIPVIATYVGSGTLSYSATGLPVGVGINAASGLISGTITAGDATKGPYSVDVKVTDGTFIVDVTFNWIITQGSDIVPVLTNPGTRTSVVGATVNLPLTFTATVGDPLSFTADGLPDGLYIDSTLGVISGTIAEDAVGAASATITATNGKGTATQTFNWIVNNSVLAVHGVTFTAVEGANSGLVTVATFTNSDPNWTLYGFSATIAWGDGKSGDGTVDGANGVYTVKGDHVYNHPGNFSPIVTVTDGFQTGTGSVGTATITAAPLTMTGGFQQGEVVGTEVTGDWATFTDANPKDLASTYTASISWGDNSSSPGTVTGFGGEFVVSGSHAYSTKGPFAVTVTVIDVDGTQGLAYSTAQVGAMFVGVSSNLAVASFKSSDPNATAGQFMATVVWGDGSRDYYNAKVTQNSDGSFTVTAQHTFAVDSLDATNSAYVVSVTITGPQFSTTVTTKNVEVVRPVATGKGDNVVAKAGVAFNNVEVATFTEPNASDSSGEYAATINWGDGTTSSDGLVVEVANGEFQVLGGHTYAAAGKYVIQTDVAQAWDERKNVITLLGGGLAAANAENATRTDVIKINQYTILNGAKQLKCSTADNFKEVGPVKLATTADKKGSTLDIWCTNKTKGGDFQGVITPKNGKAINFGKCLVEEGVNYWITIQDGKTGDFKAIFWINIQPTRDAGATIQRSLRPFSNPANAAKMKDEHALVVQIEDNLKNIRDDLVTQIVTREKVVYKTVIYYWRPEMPKPLVNRLEYDSDLQAVFLRPDPLVEGGYDLPPPRQ